MNRSEDERATEEERELLPEGGDTSEKKVFKVYPYRWIGLAAFCLAMFANNIASGFFSPLTTIFKRAYHIHLIEADLCLMVYIIIFPWASIFSTWALNKWGTFIGLIIASVGMAASVWWRLLINVSFYLVYVGNVFGGLTQTFLLNAPPKISVNWFPPEERFIATTISSLAPLMGTGAGMFLPFAEIDQDEHNESTLKDQIYKAALLEAAIITGCLVIACLFYRDRPKTPPSMTASEQEVGGPGAWESAKTMLKDKNFLLMALFLCFAMGVQCAASGNVEAMKTAFKKYISDHEGAAMGLGMNYASFIGAIMYIYILRKTNKYKLVSLLLLFVGAGATGMWVALLFTNTFYWPMIGACVFGLVVGPATPIALEFGCELAYPAREEAVSAVINSFGQYLFFINFAISAYVLQDPDRETMLYLLIVLVALMASLALLMFLFVKENLKRQKHDLAHGRIETENEIEEELYVEKGHLIQAKSIELGEVVDAEGEGITKTDDIPQFKYAIYSQPIAIPIYSYVNIVYIYIYISSSQRLSVYIIYIYYILHWKQILIAGYMLYVRICIQRYNCQIGSNIYNMLVTKII